MARTWLINGPCLVLVKGRSDSGIGTLQQLGLSIDQIQVQQQYRYAPLTAEAWGGADAEEQFMLGHAIISMNLVHLDLVVLQNCIQESLAGGDGVTGFGTFSEGSMPLTGALLGNNLPRFSGSGGVLGAGNHLIGLNLTSPVGLNPYRFFTTYLESWSFPLGAEKSIVPLRWKAILYPNINTSPSQGTPDPYGFYVNGLGQTIIGGGAQTVRLYDHMLDT